MARRNSGGNYMYGVCTNTDHDGDGNPCPKCASKEIQKIRGGKDFVCEECGESLTKVNSGGDPPYKLIGIIAAAVIVLAGIGFGVYKLVSGGNKITAIKLDKKTLTMNVGDKELLTASVEPKDAKATFIWKSSDKSIVNVVGGEIAALKKGNATITVKVEEFPELRGVTCKIEVTSPKDIEEAADSTKTKENSGKGKEPVLISTLTLVPSSLTLTEGETGQLQWQAIPTENDEELMWSTTNPNVATVSAEGVVHAIGAGTATITLLSDKSGKEANTTVTVKKKNTGGSTGGTDTSVNKKRGTLNLGYASYSGDIKYGKMDGAGVLTYKQKHAAGRDFKTGEQVYAEPGERVDGVWNNGYLSSGTLFKNNGNAVKIKY